MSILLSSIIRAQGLLDRLTLSRDSFHPRDAQIKFLLRLLKENKNTQFGKKHAFASIVSEKDYRNNVPVVEYAGLEPYIDRIKMGHANILTRDPVFMFNLTSGTTARPKYIPITNQGQKRTGRLMRQWLCHALSAHPLILDKGFMSITGAAIEGRCESGIPYGSASGMIYKTLPNILKDSFAIPTAAAEIEDYDIRYYVLLRFAYERSISFIATPNPLTLIKLAETAMENHEEIIRSIHNGWLSGSLKSKQSCTTAGVPDILRSSLKPNKARAVFLEKVLKKTRKLLPFDCWPDLKLIGCWLGGSIGFHADALDKYYGNTPLRDLGYMASEGCITLPVKDATPAGILALQNNYYEFIPEGQLNSSQPDILTAGELNAGSCYKILLTNENGLYRYDINDIVKVEGFYHQTPIISFLRKSGNILNIAGEKLHLNHCLSAIAKIQSRFSIDIHRFRVVPDQENLRHEFFIDIKSGVSDKFMHREILPALDAYLCENNIEYDSRRKSKRINAPCIHVMDSAWEDDVKREQGNFGRSDVQYKWIQLSTDKIDVDYRHIKYTIK